jgi:hypothetical protein
MFNPGPSPNDLLILKLVLNGLGPLPRLSGMRGSKAEGRRVKEPYFVLTMFVLLSVANAGRSLNWLSPFKSWPVVMLKGVPESSNTKGLIETPKSP